MSAAKDKRKPNSDGFGIGNNKNNKKADSSKKTARIAAITAAAIAILFLGSLFINSNYLRQNFAAVTIDNVKYSVTDFNYYYRNVYIQYYNAMQGASGQFGGSLLPSAQSPLESQIYDEATGKTWADFFEELALEQMKADNKIYIKAMDAGYQLTEDDQKKIDTEIENMKNAAYSSGYPKFSDYLKAAYGKAMDEAAYLKNVERSYTIIGYTDLVRDSFNYTSEDIEAYYTENKDIFDTFTYRYFLVKAAEINESDYADTAAYDAAKAEALKASGDEANEFKAKITDVQSFIEAAREYDPETYKVDSASQRIYRGELLGSTYGDWLRDESRKNGDVEAFETTTGYYVVMFESRDNNHYATVNIQQVLIKQETVDASKYEDEADSTAYDAAVAEAKKTAKDTADKIYQEWVDSGATQDQLTQLMTAYSTQISADDSKLSENVYNGQLPAEVNSWLFDAARKPGDHAIIYVESTGYYIVNYLETGKQYSDVLSDTKKRDKDLQAWRDTLTGGEPKMTWLMTLTK